MIKKRWIVVSVMMGLLAVGITGGAVFAQEVGDPERKSPFGGFASRVAGILGLDEQQVQDAFHQAATEIEDERLQQKLDGLVEKGYLTPEQAEEYGNWYRSRPETSFGKFGFRGFGGHRSHHGRFWGGKGKRGIAGDDGPVAPPEGAIETTF